MRIKLSVYRELLNLPSVPPEVGGILGSHNDIIDVFIKETVDANNRSSGVYIPNVEFLNKCINRWYLEGGVFSGMFHTHALNWPELSCADNSYIHEIMSAMPININRLYFPIVFPNSHIKVYCAYRKEKIVYIDSDKIQIV